MTGPEMENGKWKMEKSGSGMSGAADRAKRTTQRDRPYLEIMKRLIIAVWLLCAVVVHAADLSRGITFTDGQRITAAQLHQLIDNAQILPGYYTGKVSQTNLNATDILLVYSAASGTFHQVNGAQLFLNNTDWINSRTEKLRLNTNDYFVVYDVDGGIIAKVALTNILYGGNQSVIAGARAPTNIWNNYTLLAWDNTSTPNTSNYWRLTITNLYDNLGSNWFSWFQLGPTNSGHTNVPLAAAPVLTDTNRFWTSRGDANANTNLFTTWGQMKQSVTNTSTIGQSVDLLMQATNATIQLLSCTDMVLKATNGASYTTGAFTLTNNLLLANPTNGVDTAIAGVSSNWYYIHVMSDGTNLATIASLSSNNPALPAPFVYRALAGPAFYDSASHYYTNYQVGREVFLYQSNVFSGSLATSFAMQTLTAISNAIPPIATQVYGSAGTSTSSGSTTLALAADNSGLGEVNLNIGSTGANSTDSMFTSSGFRLLIRTNQSFALKRGSINNTYRVDVSGYRF
jgi:hypothetical protein